MVKYLSREEERRGSRRITLLWGLVVAVALGCGITLLSYFFSVAPNQSVTDATGSRSFQNAGESIAGKTTEPTPRSAGNFAARGRAVDITASGTGEVQLTREQVDAISRYFQRHPDQGINQADFTIAIGTAVPHQQALNDLSRDLADAIPAYGDEHYLFVGHRLVIVEKNHDESSRLFRRPLEARFIA